MDTDTGLENLSFVSITINNRIVEFYAWFISSASMVRVFNTLFKLLTPFTSLIFINCLTGDCSLLFNPMLADIEWRLGNSEFNLLAICGQSDKLTPLTSWNAYILIERDFWHLSPFRPY